MVLRNAHNNAEIEGNVKSKIDEFAARGFRALGLAIGQGGSGKARFAVVYSSLYLNAHTLILVESS